MLNRNLYGKLIIFIFVMALVLTAAGGCAGRTRNEDAADKDIEEEAAGEGKNEKPRKPDPDETYLMDESDEEEDSVIKAEYKVEKGVFEKREFSIGTIRYTDLEYEQADISTDAYVKKMKVNVGDKVKKGDVILTYEPQTNEIELLRKTSEVEKREKEYDAGLDSRKAELKMAENELKALSDPGLIKIKKLEIEKLKLGLEKYKATKKPIEEDRAALNEIIKDNKPGRITASHAGYVMSIYDLEKDSSITKGQYVAMISEKKEYYVEVEDKSQDNLRYGDTVKIVVEGRKGGKNIEVEGKVISASNILNPRSAQDTAIVEIIDEPAGVDWENPIKVYYNVSYAEDALMIPIKAIMHEKSGGGTQVAEVPYVYVKKKDTIVKRYIGIVEQNKEYARVTDGVEEGDILIVYNHS